MPLNKDECLKKMKQQYDELNYRWSVERDKWEAEAQKAGAEARKRFEKKSADLRALRREVKEKIVDLEVAGDNAWEDVKDGAEKAWKELNEAFRKARSRF